MDGGSARCTAATYTVHKDRRGAVTQPFLELDSNSRSQCSRGRRHFVTSTSGKVKKKIKAVLVAGSETSRLPHFLDNRLTKGGEDVKFTRRPPFTPGKITGTHFCYMLSRPQGHSAIGRIRSIEKSNDPIGNRTRDLPACSTVPRGGEG
jgi:hypothetical protein